MYMKLHEQMEYVECKLSEQLPSLSGACCRLREINLKLYWSVGNSQYPKREPQVLKSDTHGGCLMQNSPHRTGV
jgi:hypothetical protein